MPDTVLNALKNKLERYEASGEADRVKRVKARIAELEKAPTDVKAPALPVTLSPPVTESAPAQVVTTTTTVKPTVQKVSASKKAAARKKK